MVKISEHEHSLKLVDLEEKLEESDEEEEEDEEKDIVTQEILFTCMRCEEEILEYHRYYYKCIMDDSCVYHLHKSCGEISTTFKHSSEPHPLTLCKACIDYYCYYCREFHKGAKMCYRCITCSSVFGICVKSVAGIGIRRIYHPSHLHPLVSPLSIPILCKCNACGIEHKGVFFICTTCFDFAIHTDCIKLPKRLLIQTTNDNFHHTHPLTLSYSFPLEEQDAKYYPHCRVCGCSFDDRLELWIYKCERCIYYIHVRCAKSKQKPLAFIKNFVDADYPHLLHLPFPDETYSIPRHLFSKGTRTPTDEVSITHQHDLVLVDTKYIDSLGGSTSSKFNPLIVCHNPMKKIQLLCNGCLRPITEMPFYKCGANEDESCNFVIHEWCARLPRKVDHHPCHPQHTLLLMPSIPHAFFNIFNCGVCGFHCNEYAYCCLKCEYYVDVSCAFIPEKITHKSHPFHLLSIVDENDRVGHMICLICHERYFLEKEHGFSCNICGVYIHLKCAIMLPETIRHPYDKHPMRFSNLPIENHKSECFCEICEYGLNPHESFYHCVECAQSVHSACAPLILRCETETSIAWGSVYIYLNVKFGGTHKIDSHAHLLTFAQGIESDGQCNICDELLQYRMIFKCVECEFAIHYECCKEYHSSSV